jgi:hypothetical protein
MEVSFSSFHIPQVPNLIKSKTEGAKNKGRKAQGANRYLTLQNIYRLREIFMTFLKIFYDGNHFTPKQTEYIYIYKHLLIISS